MTELPVLDLADLDRGEAAAADLRARLLAATHDVGFFVLTGHGVEPALEQRVHRVAREFFALAAADKLAIENLRSPQFRGYTRIGGERTEGEVDWREQIDIGPERETVEGGADYWRLEGPNQWPAALPELREAFEAWYERLSAVAHRLLGAWAEALGSPADVFEPAFLRPSAFIKVVRYPGSDAPTPQQGVGAHKDGGVLTLLWIEPGKGGLQVEGADGWFDVPPLEGGAFVVNIGELLEHATSGYLQATRHRVVSPAAGTDRLSIPFFFNPSLDAQIPVLDLPPALAAEARGVSQDPSNPIHALYGENALKWRLRAHPDVAALHHPDLVAARAA